MRVIVAHSLLSYREAISATLEALRPHLEILPIELENLNEEFRRVSPQLVVCSRVTELVEREVFGWIELYPEHGSESVVSLGGEKVTYPQMDVEALLSILDEAERLHETAQN